MNTQPSLRLPRASVTAPSFRADPVAWGVWYMRQNAHVYEEFRRLTLEMVRRRPDIERLSADQVLHVVRWNSQLHASGDVVAVNNNASAMFARLFAEERPHHRDLFETRRSVWDALPRSEWLRITLAYSGFLPPERFDRRPA